jgi:hypothetical protein
MRTVRRKAAKPPTLAKMRPTILEVAARYGATNVRIFGSYARGEQHTRSDIDLLVTLPKKASLLDLAGIKVDLEEALHRKVDVLTEGGISRYLRERILQEAKPL